MQLQRRQMPDMTSSKQNEEERPKCHQQGQTPAVSKARHDITQSRLTDAEPAPCQGWTGLTTLGEASWYWRPLPTGPAVS